MRNRISKKGFTLVEILIVVIILGILAAIIIPQFTDASNEARDSSLTSSLQTLRSQLELYKVQHLDEYPDVGTDAAGFVTRMTTKTDEAHAADANGYGPYFNKFPSNPFSPGLPAVRFDDIANAGAGTAQWVFDTNTGQIAPDDATDLDGNGTADHIDY